MKREVVFTKDGDYWVSLDPPGSHVYPKDKLAITVEYEPEKGESSDSIDSKCIEKAAKQLIRRYFNLRSYTE